MPDADARVRNRWERSPQIIRAGSCSKSSSSLLISKTKKSSRRLRDAPSPSPSSSSASSRQALSHARRRLRVPSLQRRQVDEHRRRRVVGLCARVERRLQRRPRRERPVALVRRPRVGPPRPDPLASASSSILRRALRAASLAASLFLPLRRGRDRLGLLRRRLDREQPGRLVEPKRPGGRRPSSPVSAPPPPPPPPSSSSAAAVASPSSSPSSSTRRRSASRARRALDAFARRALRALATSADSGDEPTSDAGAGAIAALVGRELAAELRRLRRLSREPLERRADLTL